MPEGHLENKWLQTHYAKGHSAQSDLFWRLHFLLLYASKWFFFVYGVWGVLTELGFSVTLKSQVGSLFDESNLRWNIFACEIYSPIAGVVIISDSAKLQQFSPKISDCILGEISVNYTPAKQFEYYITWQSHNEAFSRVSKTMRTKMKVI